MELEGVQLREKNNHRRLIESGEKLWTFCGHTGWAKKVSP